MPTVAIASDFLEAYARIPRAQQKKVREFTEKFQANPKAPSINYEKIHAVKDDRVRTVRIDQQYRAIILHPAKGDVFVLVWVDNHDEAMDWAKNRTFEINPVTGSLQVFNVSEAEQAVVPPTKTKAAGLLEQFEDDLLLSFGVPAVLLPAVRGVRKPDDLLALNKHLPAECAEALMWLLEGLPPDEVREAVATQKKVKVDTTDLAKALEHPDSRRRFVTILSDKDLTAILNAPLEKWRVFLHPSQEKLVSKEFKGAARVLGGAGTGKTVVAMHRARHLANTVFTENKDRILFTTYTGNLAQNVEEMLSTLCPECKDRIEAVHLHSWAARFMKSHGAGFDIAYGEDLDACWEQAWTDAEETAFDVGFLRQEWDQVIQANGIETLAEYLKVPRTGRGHTLTRRQRGRVWKVFERYLDVLKTRGKQEWLQAIRATRQYLEENKPTLPYRAVVVDEAQDFHAEEWKLIRALVPAGLNDLFLVGDAHQRIYGRKVALSRCGIQIQGRSSKLRINYRTTEQIRAWAMAMLQGVEVDDLDGERDTAQGYRSLLSGAQPNHLHFPTSEKEQEFLSKELKELLKDRRPEEICIVARTTKMLKDDYQALLKSMGITHTVLEKNKVGAGGGIRLATMHRVKGLEFPVMILAGMNSKTMPLRVTSVEGDPTSKAEHENRERSLLFVAATRARDQLIVTSWGSPSPFL
jgi:mRNA-degrading endonuclease RelE of RelBE toxin-antitoxin system